MQPEHSGPSSALALFKLTPPYTRFEEMPGLDASEMPDLPLGSVLVIELSDHAAWPAVAQAAPRLRARFPAAPLALRVRNGVGIDPFRWSCRADVTRPPSRKPNEVEGVGVARQRATE